MITRVSILCACLFVAFVPAPSSGQSPTASPALKSHHLINLPDGMTEAVLVGAMEEVNGAITKSGYPDDGYRLWKVTGEQAGEFSYLWEGVWSDQATYDAIHEGVAWNALSERSKAIFDRVAEGQVYNHFIEIPAGGPGS